MNTKDIWKMATAKGLPRDGCLLIVDISRQLLYFYHRGEEITRYPVSTSARGIGSKEDSLKTPPGWHQVAAWIGDGEPIGRVFKARVPTTTIYMGQNAGGKDLILTRILRLDGLEEGLNKGPGIDSFDRYIYLHGTNQEERLGQPASRGCIRLSNIGILDLFRRTKGKTTWCWIGPVDITK